MFDKTEWLRQWRLKNPDYHRDWQRNRRKDPEERQKDAVVVKNYRKRHPDRVRATRAKMHKARPHLRSNWDRKKNYGMTPGQYAEMLSKQKFVCAFCSGDNGGSQLHVDHDHSKPKGDGNRWLLCRSCNLMIGHAREDSKRMRLAADKLDEYHGYPVNSSGFHSRGQDFAFGPSAALSLPG